MSTTQLFWQRERPLADFSDNAGNRGNLIFVTTQRGVQHAVDDIFDDFRNDVLNLVMISGDENSDLVHLYSLEKNGIELKEDHAALGLALASATREVAGRSGSVVIVDSVSLVIDSESRSAISDLMAAAENHVVLIVAVEGIEAMQHYLSHDPYIVIDVEEKTGAVSI